MLYYIITYIDNNILMALLIVVNSCVWVIFEQKKTKIWRNVMVH